ncbi:MAG: malonyl-CoA decarboxylase [Bryobacterales bacterium]|nr:malonyl-CoA decarboxylase [Bryobacterales bacterium]
MRLARFLERSARSSLAPASDSRSIRRLLSLCRALLSERGAINSSHLAAETLDLYHALDPPARRAFFEALIVDFSPDPEDVGRAADAYRKDASFQNLSHLQRVVEPPRQELFRQLNLAPEGTRILVEMRSQVLREMDSGPHLEPIAADLAHLLTSWFNRGFLTLQRIDWHSSAAVLQKLIEYEAVHQIHGWHDLRRRLEADRRCYAFFHSAMPEEPLIFIEAALTRGMSDRVQPLLDPGSPVKDPASADTAIFYSITNCQEGLRSVPFGSFLIKHVVEDLRKNLPQLRTFATLSPIPGFRRWLAAELEKLESILVRAEVRRALEQLDGPDSDRIDSEQRRYLEALCAFYLLNAKRGEEPLDSVARFHLKNGARLDRINWLADTSASGMKQSLGMMANYLYELNDLERNCEIYARRSQVASSRRVQASAKRVIARKSLRAEPGAALV